jgi:hypothetical protein
LSDEELPCLREEGHGRRKRKSRLDDHVWRLLETLANGACAFPSYKSSLYELRGANDSFSEFITEGKMKKVVITIYGKDYDDLSMAAQHAADQLQMKTPSENIEWEDKSRVDFTVVEDATAEHEELYGD